MFRRSRTEESWKWRHEIPLPEKVERFGADEERLDSAWRQLIFVHTSFRATEQQEYRDLVDALRGIERLFFDHPELSAYYDEWGSMRSSARRAAGRSAPARRAADADVSGVRNPAAAPRRAEATAGPPSPLGPRVRHVAAMQAQFMEDVYFVLQLARFANALDNRGWMNLFRAWGRSKTFNGVFSRLRPTFAQEFVEFYDNYIRDYPGSIEDYPLPHPWDSETLRADPRHVPAAPPRAAAEAVGPEAPAERPGAETRVAAPAIVTLPGVFLDSGVQEVGRRPGRVRAPTPSPGAGSRGVGEDPNLAAAVEQVQSSEESRSPSQSNPNA